MEDINNRTLQQFFNNLKTFKGGKASRSIQGKVKSLLSRIFLYAVDERIIQFSPMGAGIKLPKLVKIDPRKKKIDLELLKVVMATVRQSDIYYPILYTLLGTGMRIGELLALEYGDIDFENRYIIVERAYKRYIDVKGENIEEDNIIDEHGTGATKTVSGERCIVVHQSLLDLLARQRQQMENEGRTIKLVFPNNKNEMRSYHGIRRQILRFWDENNIDKAKVTFHAFRHSYSTYMRAAKVDRDIRCSLMGHKNGNVTEDVYTDIEIELIYEAVDMYYEYMKDIFDAGF